jgi:hypothetical protein
MSGFWDLDGGVPKGVVSPGAQLDFPQDWTAWLDGAAVASMVWTVPAGLAIIQQTEVAGVMTVWLSGFVAGKTYKIVGTLRTDTSPYREDSRIGLLVCRPR